jgi:hypothetical protein
MIPASSTPAKTLIGRPERAVWIPSIFHPDRNAFPSGVFALNAGLGRA